MVDRILALEFEDRRRTAKASTLETQYALMKKPVRIPEMVKMFRGDLFVLYTEDQIKDCVRKIPGVTFTDYRLLSYIHRLDANTGMGCWAGQKAFAKELACSPNAASMRLKRLKRIGLIAVLGATANGNVFRRVRLPSCDRRHDQRDGFPPTVPPVSRTVPLGRGDPHSKIYGNGCIDSVGTPFSPGSNGTRSDPILPQQFHPSVQSIAHPVA